MPAQVTADVLSSQRKMMEGTAYNDEAPGVAQESGNKMRELYQKGKDKAVRMEEGFEHYVQKKPVQSVLIAAGVGALVGYLLGRRR